MLAFFPGSLITTPTRVAITVGPTGRELVGVSASDGRSIVFDNDSAYLDATRAARLVRETLPALFTARARSGVVLTSSFGGRTGRATRRVLH